MFELGSLGRHLSELELQEWDAVKLNTNPDIPLGWNNADGKTFRVRTGPNYKKNGKKTLSGDSMYECVGVDFISDPNKLVSNVGASCKLPEPRDCDDLKAIALSGLPRIIIINIQIPFKGASVMGGASYYDGDHGCSLVICFAIKPETVKEALSDNPRPGVNLLKTFMAEWNNREDMRKRFKTILNVDNIDDMPIRGIGMLKGYNGKPAIINKLGDRFMDDKKTEYFELDLNVRRAKLASRKGLDMVRDVCGKGFLRIGFVIQGETDDELDELVFGCANIRNLDMQKHMSVNI